jgi:6-phosphogluconate dehydrogenase (decarboxylating)
MVDGPGGSGGEDYRRPPAHLAAEDILIDGGNSHYVDDIRRARELAAKRIHYVDVGTSGGVWGLERGYCIDDWRRKGAVKHIDPIFSTLAPGKGEVPAHTWTREANRHRRAGLPALRSQGRRAFRQDGPQRHRVRPHGRFTSRGEAHYQDRLLSAMRYGFGGHLEKAAGK